MYSELIKRLRRRLVMSMFPNSTMLYDTLNIDRDDYENTTQCALAEKAITAINALDTDGPGEEDGPWSPGWKERCGEIK